MRLRNISGSRDVIADSKYVIQDPKSAKGNWRNLFGASGDKLMIEVGMGKGRFIYTQAQLHPDTLYVGIEKYSSVLLRAIQKMELDPLPNLMFLRMDAEELTDVFAPGEVDLIYLNFSDPWPKDRHAKRRLPSAQFLERYDVILKQEGSIEFKTDNRPLFDFALEQLEESVFKASVVSFDLHADSALMEGNVMTEYEERFSSMGNPIFKYVLVRKA